MGKGLIVDVDPRELNPLSLALVGKLGDILTVSGAIEVEDTTRGMRRHQLFRYYCGSDAYARMVRLQVLVADQIRYTITPKSANDEFYLDGLISEGDPFKLRISRDLMTDPAALPNPFPDVDVRFEAFG
ncbi:MAG TPA: hypothetical protein VF768_04230 [Holophagaceae bacterium]